MATAIKGDTIKGKQTMNEKLNVQEYDASTELNYAMKSRNEEVTSWQYIESNNTNLSDCTHVIPVTRSWGMISDFYLDIYIPANTYVAHTAASMIKEIRFNYGNGDPIKYSGETLDFLLSHANKKVVQDIIHGMQGNSTSAVSAAKWITIPLIAPGSKCLFSEESDLFNTPFELYKMANDMQIEIDFFVYTKYVTTGSNTTGKVRFAFKQYDYMLNTPSPLLKGSVSPSTYVFPYTLINTDTVSATAGSELSVNVTNIKENGELIEVGMKLVADSDYKATAPLYFTTVNLTTAKMILKNTNIYEAYGPNIIKRQYLNEYGHENIFNLAGTSTYEYVVMDLSETPKIVYSAGIGSVGINIYGENPRITVTPVSGSSTAGTLWQVYVFKALFVIKSNGICQRYLTL